MSLTLNIKLSILSRRVLALFPVDLQVKATMEEAQLLIITPPVNMRPLRDEPQAMPMRVLREAPFPLKVSLSTLDRAPREVHLNYQEEMLVLLGITKVTLLLQSRRLTLPAMATMGWTLG